MALQPKLAKKIPPAVDVELIESDPPAAVAKLVQIGHEARWVALALLLIGLVLALAAIRLASDRRRGGLTVGISLGLVAVLTLVVLKAIQALLLTSLDDQGARDAALGIWDAYLGDLTTALLLAAACGAVIAAAASSLLRPVDVRAQLERAWNLVATVPEGRGRRALRAIALIVVGVLIVTRRDAFLELVALAIGLYVIYAGVAELMRLTMAAPEQETEALERGQRALVASIVAGVLVLVGAGIFIGVGGISEEPLALGSEGCNGSRELCERPLDTVAFASTHNSMSAASNPGWLSAQQERGFPDQLRDGIRGYLIDAHYGVETEDGTIKTDLSELSPTARAEYEESLGSDALDSALRIRDRIVNSKEVGERAVYLCHRFCELGAIPIEKAFGDFRDFLAANPEEVLVVTIEDYVDPEQIGEAAERSGLVDYIYEGPVEPPWPTLGEMVDSGGRILMMAENQGGGTAYPWYHEAYAELLQETPFSFQRPAQLTDPKLIPASCKPNRGPKGAPFFLINHWIDTSPAPLPSNAAKVNAREALLRRVHECERMRGAEANLIAVDFYRVGDVVGVTDELNRERAAH